MEIINGTSLSNLCDYSFGDHMGACSIPKPTGGFMRAAHPSNGEFLIKCKQFEGKIMTLFIDNIRLYTRPIYANEGNDSLWVNYLLNNNDLLAMCRQLVDNKFIIFTSHEDTPIDEYINIPPNVLGIHAVNAAYFNDKIHPFPYGLQRQMGANDHRIEIMQKEVEEDKHYKPSKLLYINCGLGKERNDKERASLPYFEKFDWATCRFDKDSKFFGYDRYLDFLNEVRDHKFMVCPQGHGMDCHRNWESLYLRRVPVMKETPYFRRLMQGFPVLFVNDWSDITPELLEDNNHLYEEAQKMSLKKLDLNLIFEGIVNSYKT
jgi:hypothetical protein